MVSTLGGVPAWLASEGVGAACRLERPSGAPTSKRLAFRGRAVRGHLSRDAPVVALNSRHSNKPSAPPRSPTRGWLELSSTPPSQIPAARRTINSSGWGASATEGPTRVKRSQGAVSATQVRGRLWLAGGSCVRLRPSCRNSRTGPPVWLAARTHHRQPLRPPAVARRDTRQPSWRPGRLGSCALAASPRRLIAHRSPPRNPERRQMA